MLRLYNIACVSGRAVTTAFLALCLGGGSAAIGVVLALTLLVATRSAAIPAFIALSIASMLAVLHSWGIRPVFRMNGGVFDIAFIRHGAPVEGLRPGVLLLASRSIDGTGLFARSVVLILEATDRGPARGLVLTHPLQPHYLDTPLEMRDHFAQYGAKVRHLVGGPLNISEDTTVVHNVHNVVGATPLNGDGTTAVAMVGGELEPALAQLFRQNSTVRGRRRGDQRPGGHHRTDQARVCSRQGSYEFSNDTSAESNEEAGDEANSSMPNVIIPRLNGTGHTREGHPQEPCAHIFHGVASWAPGQLQGEIRSGSWGLCGASSFDVFEVAPEALWQRVSSSGLAQFPFGDAAEHHFGFRP